MVSHPRKADGHGRIRPLNRPRPVRVEADAEGRPLAVTLRGQRLRVLQVQDTWRIDDEWWRERPVNRVYYRVALKDGRVVTVYKDLVSGRWARQRSCA